MPYTLSVSRVDRVGVVRLSGALDGYEIVAAAAALARHPDWRGGYRVVWDTTRIEALDFAPVHFAALLDQEARLDAADATGDVVVITRDEVWASLVVLFRAHVGEGRSVTTVPTAADAEALLGVALPVG